jgi:hypothetical protein
MKRWMDDASVQHEIIRISKYRETGLFVGNPTNMFPVRRVYVPNRKTFQLLLDKMNYGKKPISLFVGSNVIDWRKVEPIPPLLWKVYTPEWKLYKNTWNGFMDKKHKSFSDIWIKKNLIWDFDKAEEPLQAFGWADELCVYLDNQGYSPKMVFSGNKGFHVWLDDDESMKLIDKTLADFKDSKDPMLEFGRHCAKVIQNTMEFATGKPLEVCDLSPVRRQGLIRTPYSIHPKSGQIVWPLNGEDLNKLRNMDNRKASPVDIAKELHSWNSPSENDFVDGKNVVLYHPPFNKVFQRGMPVWES